MDNLWDIHNVLGDMLAVSRDMVVILGDMVVISGDMVAISGDMVTVLRDIATISRDMVAISHNLSGAFSMSCNWKRYALVPLMSFFLTVIFQHLVSHFLKTELLLGINDLK